jgi:CHAT domain-containing protein
MQRGVIKGLVCIFCALLIQAGAGAQQMPVDKSNPQTPLNVAPKASEKCSERTAGGVKRSGGAGCEDPERRPAANNDRATTSQQQDAETLAHLSADGQLLYSRDRVKLSGFQYCNQSVSLAERGDFRQSIRAASKALYLGQQGDNADLVAVSKRDLAIAYSYAGNLDRAEQYAREALSHESHNPQLVGGPSLKVLGDVSIRRGNITEGIGFYEQALKAASQKFQPLVRISLANAYVRAGELAAARSQYEQTPAPENPALRLSYLRGNAELLLAEGKPSEALALFQAVLKDANGADADYHRLWAHEGVGRSHLALQDRPAALQAYLAAIEISDSVRSRFRSEEFKTGLFGDMQKIFEQTISLAMENGDTVTALEISERSRARALLDIVRERVDLAKGAGSLSSNAKNAAAIRAALLPKEVLVEFHSIGDRLFAWTIRADGINGFTINMPRAELTQRVETFRSLILNPRSTPQEEGRNLYRLLVQPLNLQAGERMVVIPHGPLHYFPFQALRTDSGYLIERHELSVSPSASVAVQLLGKREEGQPRLVAFGNPEIETKYDLPGSQREVEQLANLFTDRQVFLRREASKNRFKESAGDSRILHVAAHAEVDPVDPLFSRILLAGGENGGALEARELFDIKLDRVALVTLSACESGLGKIAGGDEILGFTRSFLSAGASSLIVSLWPVADDSTELLMTTLYGNLVKGSDLQKAMQTAQLTVLKNKRFAHPYFWAPFNLVGDWRQKFQP